MALQDVGRVMYGYVKLCMGMGWYVVLCMAM